MPGRVWLLVGPSGTGKTTLAKDLPGVVPGVVRAVTATTRAPRPGEVEGRDYRFLTREAFQDLLARGGLVEHAEYGGNLYGMPAEQFQALEDRDLVAVVEVEGVRSLRVVLGRERVTAVFLQPPPPEVLAARMAGRGSSDAEVARRLALIEAEAAVQAECDVTLEVRDYPETLEALAGMVRGR